MSVPVFELLEHTRGEVLRDAVGPYLFGNEALLRHLNEGYKLFARHTHCFIDFETIETEAGVRLYQAPERVIYIRQAWCEGRFLTPFTRRARLHFGLSGQPAAFSTDSGHKKVHFYPTPNAAYSVELTCAVSPALVDEGSDIELEHEWAMLLPHWIAYRALSTNDPDGSNTVAAQQFHQKWGVGLREAKMDFTRQANTDNPSAQPRRWI